VLATKLGTSAVDLVENGEFGYMVAVKGGGLTKVRLQDVAKGQRTVRDLGLTLRAAAEVMKGPGRMLMNDKPDTVFLRSKVRLRFGCFFKLSFGCVFF
jgi:hypothetical protein